LEDAESDETDGGAAAATNRALNDIVIAGGDATVAASTNWDLIMI
jgi:hypothetical protein